MEYVVRSVLSSTPQSLVATAFAVSNHWFAALDVSMLTYAIMRWGPASRASRAAVAGGAWLLYTHLPLIPFGF